MNRFVSSSNVYWLVAFNAALSGACSSSAANPPGTTAENSGSSSTGSSGDATGSSGDATGGGSITGSVSAASGSGSGAASAGVGSATGSEATGASAGGSGSATGSSGVASSGAGTGLGGTGSGSGTGASAAVDDGGSSTGDSTGSSGTTQGASGASGSDDAGKTTQTGGGDASLPSGCTASSPVSFQKDVQPFLITSCGGGNGCHIIDATSTVASGGYNHAYDWITAGAHASSCPETPTPERFQVVLAVINAANPPTCSKSRIMPPTTATQKPLTACEIATLAAWLNEPLVTQKHRADDSSPTTPYPMPPFN